MKNLLAAFAAELKSPATTHVAAAGAGAIVVAAYQYRLAKSGRAFILSKDAYDALVNDGTNFVRFAPKNNEHAFRVTLEQWV